MFRLLKHKGTSIYKFHFIKNDKATWVRIASFWKEAVLLSIRRIALGGDGTEEEYNPKTTNSLGVPTAHQCNEMRKRNHIPVMKNTQCAF